MHRHRGVPAIMAGQSIKIRTRSGTLVASGTFHRRRQTASQPSQAAKEPQPGTQAGGSGCGEPRASRHVRAGPMTCPAGRTDETQTTGQPAPLEPPKDAQPPDRGRSHLPVNRKADAAPVNHFRTRRPRTGSYARAQPR